MDVERSSDLETWIGGLVVRGNRERLIMMAVVDVPGDGIAYS